MNLSKILSVIFCSILLTASAPAQKDLSQLDRTEADRAWQLLETSDSRGAFEYLADLLARNGASINIRGTTGLGLELKEVSEVINDYSGYERTISVSRMPNLPESKIYWENWSKVLAKGNFDYEKFFRNERERFILANFNSLVLMAHEYGHYLDDRYQRYQSKDQPLNCGEYFADKFAVAVINHLARDERFDELRRRYLELIRTFNQSLPKKNQIRIADYETLRNNCTAVKIAGNGVNPDGSLDFEFFRTYASAYFNRHQLMLADTNYPSLSALIEADLTEPYFASIKHSAEKVTVRTIGEFKIEFEPELFDYDFESLLQNESNSPKLNQTSQTQSAIDHKGEIVHLRANWRGEKAVWQNLKIEYLDAEKKIKDSFSVELPKYLQNQSYLFGFSPVSDDELILFFNFFAQSSGCADNFARAFRTKDKWQVVFSVEGAMKPVCYTPTSSNTYVTPEGKIKFIVPMIEDGKDKTEFRKYRLDHEKMIVVDEGANIVFNSPLRLRSQIIFGNDIDRIFWANSFFYELDDQTPILVGNGLAGYKDGTDKNKIELGLIEAIRWVGEKRIVFVDAIDDETHLLREIILEENDQP